MLKKMLILSGLTVLLAGCVTTRNPQLTQQLQMRVGDLERQLSQKDEEINELKYEIKDLAYELDRMKSTKTRSATSLATTMDITTEGKDEKNLIRVDVGFDKVQIALKNAGYYKGAIDNKIGVKTQEAIAKFQKDHGLKSDGIVGQKTWLELKAYLK